MTLVRRLARPMLASMFITGGIEALRNPQPRAHKAGPMATKIAAKMPVQLPQDPVDLVRADAAVKVGAGSMLAIGKFPRLSALALAGSLVPTTFAGHPYWEEKDPALRANQKIHFFKNVSMLGGLLIAAADTGGRPSVGWRARHAAEESRQAARRARRKTGRKAAKARKKAEDVLD